MAFEDKHLHLFNGDSMALYDSWETPVVIVSDGPYGVKGFPGDLKTAEGLATWYEPHIKAWTRKATPKTTLWFWCTEQGWAAVHPVLLKYGWEYKACNVWDKGMSHVAGNVNTKTLSHLPVVSEVCVQYVKKPVFHIGEQKMNMSEWLRYEWKRTGLTWAKANEACGVKDAAVRKYFTNDMYLWYMPPSDKFEMFVDYANKYGKPDGCPYFSIDGKKPLSRQEWEDFKPVFNCPMGITNVWSTPQLRNNERVKEKQKAVHLNQKPLLFIKRIVELSSNEGDVVWDTFGGLFTTALACFDLNRTCYSAEISPEVYKVAISRVEEHVNTLFK